MRHNSQYQFSEFPAFKLEFHMSKEATFRRINKERKKNEKVINLDLHHYLHITIFKLKGEIYQNNSNTSHILVKKLHVSRFKMVRFANICK